MTTGKLVLVVDDEDDVRRYLAAILEDGGFEVQTAADGNEALKLVEARAPDLISLDLVMPQKSGTRFLYALRKNREWSKIPVLIVTGHAHDDLGKHDLNDILAGKMISGPEVYLEKPVSPDSYVRAIKRQLGVEEEDTGAPTLPSAGPDQEISNLLDGADEATKAEILKMLRKGRGGD
jgi:CheY-like chemotaxis protein